MLSILSILTGGGLLGGIVMMVVRPKLRSAAAGAAGTVPGWVWVALGAVLLVGGLWWRGSHYRDQRDALATWQTDVTAATRLAAHRPKLATRNVALQIDYLGQELDAIHNAQVLATKQAQDAKAAKERENEQHRKDHDDALPTRIADERRRAQPWIDAHRVHGSGRDAAAGAAAGGSGRADLPSPAFGAAQPDGPDRGSELVAVPAGYIDACSVVTGRLKDAAEWARETLPPAPH